MRNKDRTPKIDENNRSIQLTMGLAEWSISVQNPIIYLTLCITIPSMALYIAEIVTIVRHKKFHHNSFYALFVMRAIPDCVGVLNSFYGQQLPSIFGSLLYPIYSKFPNWMLAMFFFVAGHTFQANNLVTAFILLNRLSAIVMPIKHEKIWKNVLPLITIFVLCVPTVLYWPVFKSGAILQLKDPNSTTDRNFIINEAGDAPYIRHLACISAIFSVLFMIKVSVIGGNNFDAIKKKLMVYAMVTFLGHALVASQILISILTNIADPKIQAMIFIYYPVVMDTGTVVLSSWLLLWASGTFRQQLIKDFAIIRIRNIRVGAMEVPQNNNHRPVGGAVGHQLHNRICSSTFGIKIRTNRTKKCSIDFASTEIPEPGL
uniref:Serpentine receptor class gamma n=1 Tax=Globodera rostochiensis TaxID=31243 RepID=A0A914HAV3_GLORO